jgi:transcriptional regulator with PAS, ATPase and Fis domain
MRPIRSLLWIGSGESLVESGMTEAPELDVTWVPSLDDALTLPRVEFDGILYEGREPGELDAVFSSVRRQFPGKAILVSLPARHEAYAQTVLDAGAAAALFLDPDAAGPGIVSQVGEALDAIHEAGLHRSEPVPIPIALAPLRPLPREALTADVAAACEDDPIRAADAVADTESNRTRDASARTQRRVVTRSAASIAVFELVERAASSRSTVLLTGETGVGKEVIARELHTRSGRDDQPFVAINCAAFPEALLESELFGHKKGAFTGADRTKVGLFQAAGEGTLFLDEIGEMGLSLQAKLLRVLQEREVRPVGSTRQIPVVCRIVAATNRVLAEEVQAGRFREDLFYRLNVFPIRIPPLRERSEDILPLARHFLELHGPREGRPDCHLSLATTQLLLGYRWPGNVRELENEILRALMLTSSGQLITPRALSPKIAEILEPIAQGARPDETLKQALDRVEVWMIRRALANNAGRRARTARKLGITREGLYKKMKRLNVE